MQKEMVMVAISGRAGVLGLGGSMELGLGCSILSWGKYQLRLPADALTLSGEACPSPP